MKTEKKQLKDFGGSLKTLKNGSRVAAFSSSTISQETIEYLSTKADIDNLLFHYCDFRDVDVSNLKETNVTIVSVMHGNFSNRHLQQFVSFGSLESIKLHDVKVSEENIKDFLALRPTVKFI